MTGARLRRATTNVETALRMIAPRPKAALSTPGPDAERCSDPRQALRTAGRAHR